MPARMSHSMPADHLQARSGSHATITKQNWRKKTVATFPRILSSKFDLRRSCSWRIIRASPCRGLEIRHERLRHIAELSRIHASWALLSVDPAAALDLCCVRWPDRARVLLHPRRAVVLRAPPSRPAFHMDIWPVRDLHFCLRHDAPDGDLEHLATGLLARRRHQDHNRERLAHHRRAALAADAEGALAAQPRTSRAGEPATHQRGRRAPAR